MLRCASSPAANVRAKVSTSVRSRCLSGLRSGSSAGLNFSRLPARTRRRSCAAAAYASHGLDAAVDARRQAQPSVYPAVTPRSTISLVPFSPTRPPISIHTLAAPGHRNLVTKAGRPGFQARQFSTRRGLPPRRSVPEKVFAGMVVLVLAAWGLFFGGESIACMKKVCVSSAYQRLRKGAETTKHSFFTIQALNRCGCASQETNDIAT